MAGSSGTGNGDVAVDRSGVGEPGGLPVAGDPERLAEASRRLRVAGQRFVVPLRRNEGFDSAALDELCEAIDSFGRAWAGSLAVPKGAALTLSELFPAIDGCAWLYPDPMRQRIREAAARVCQSVSASLDSPDGGLDPDL
jgi:hypothetical protein